MLFRSGSSNSALNGKRPTNVPVTTLRLHGGYEVSDIPGLSLGADLLAEGNRMVLADNSVRIPGYARLDASLRYANAVVGNKLVWRAGVSNLIDRRAWREAPLQFGHAYLFPLAPRTLRLSVESAW